MNIIAKANARKVIEEYCIEKPSGLNLIKIANAEYLSVDYIEIKNGAGKISFKDGYGAIGISNKITDKGQQNFVLAHELGHYFNERKNPQTIICTEKDLTSRSGREYDANVFAGELVMHEPWFLEFTKGKRLSSSLLSETADYFNTSLSSAAMRYAEIGPVPTAIILTTDGVVKYSKCNKDFPYQYIEHGMKVNNNSYTSDFYKGEIIPTSAEEIPLEAWFWNDNNYKKDQFIIEQNILMPNYNSCLTLLWEGS